MNRVCAVHNEYCPDGDCRWCVAPAAEPDEAAPCMYMGMMMVVDPNMGADEWCILPNRNTPEPVWVQTGTSNPANGLWAMPGSQWPPGGVTGSGL